jgi:hypothetical protein
MRPRSVSQLVPRVAVEFRRRRQAAAVRGTPNHPSRRQSGATIAQRGGSVATSTSQRLPRNARSRQIGATNFDLTLTEQQQVLREMAHDFAAPKIRPVAWEYDRDGS